MALRYTRFRFEVQGSRFEAYCGSRLEARGLRWFEARGSRLTVVRGSRLTVIQGFFSSRLKASSVQGSRLCQFKAQGFVSSRLEASSVQDPRLRVILESLNSSRREARG